MEDGKGNGRRPGRNRLHARWVNIVPALILLFFAASAALSPRMRGAVDDGGDPLSPPAETPVASYPATDGGVLPMSASPSVAHAGLATGLSSDSAPTALPTVAPTATPGPSATSVPITPTPSGPTSTPDKGAAGNASPVDGTIRVPVLMYHYIRINPVASDRLGYGLSVTPADFAAQMEWIVSNGYHAVFPSELSAAITHGAPLPTKPIVLTFDDGYRDFYTEAWPVLKRFGLKSASGLIMNFVDKGDRGDLMYMSWGMIKELDQTGMVEFASHTLTHPDLTRLAPAQRWAELTTSKQMIEDRLGHPCQTLIYPSGRYDGATVADAKRAGYAIAFTTNDGKVRAPQDSGVMLQLPRVRIAGGTTLAGFTKTLG